MTEGEQTKVCPLCAETIKAAAKVCPFCHTRQNGWGFLSSNNLIAVATVVLVVVIAIILGRYRFPGRTFSPTQDHIDVLSSQLSIHPGKYSTNVVITGVLTNSSPYAWQLIAYTGMEVRFFDREGKIADLYKSGSVDDFTILPASDHSFSFYLDRTSIPDYASYKVYIRSAKDPKALR